MLLRHPFNKIVVLIGAFALGACQQMLKSESPATPANVIQTYIEIAQASYGDSLATAIVLDEAIDHLLSSPSEETLKAAKAAWVEARVPYQQTEAFRFGNSVVDEWEGRVNAWPLDEGLIDYTAASYGEESDNNYFYSANIIANELIDIGGISVDADQITPQLLAETLHEIDGVESNVAIGYHAIEFLLWGQDLNGTNPGAGERPATDYSLENCTHGYCQRRSDYLKSVSTLLVDDLKEMVENWEVGGEAYKDLLSKGEQGGLATILTGMGSLAYGELAGERIRLGLLLHDPEEEHDCFSDNTHNSHYYDAKGISNVYLGEYKRVSGDVVSGPSIADMINVQAPALAAEMSVRLESTEFAMDALVAQASTGNTFDVLIGSGHPDGERVITTIVEALMEETRTIEKVITELQLENTSIEGSDSLQAL